MASHDSLVLVIDNYDSFTYNLVDLIHQFGRKTIVLRNDDLGFLMLGKRLMSLFYLRVRGIEHFRVVQAIGYLG